MAPNTKSPQEQFHGTASHREDIKGDISPFAAANFIPIIKAAILKTSSYKLRTSCKLMQLTQRQEILCTNRTKK